jgi:hydroxymethylbilane synthase
LARAQAEEVRARLIGAHPSLAESDATRITIIKTTGDKRLDLKLADIGGKGLFTKEIEEALLDRRIDIAVHSMKDVPTWLPDGLEIACVLEREDPRDALIARGVRALDELPRGARIGTSSLRRQAQLLLRRPDFEIVTLRGNVATRVRKVTEGLADATMLAIAGLKRLNATHHVDAILAVEDMLPAVAQGAIGIECRIDDAGARELLAPLNHEPSELCVRAERALLAALDGSCRTPIAALAVIDTDSRIGLRALIARPDGSACHRASREGPSSDAEALGTDAGRQLRAEAGPGFFDPAP